MRDPSYKKCAGCGAGLEKYSFFCPACGRILLDTRPSLVSKKNEPEGNRLIWRGIFIILIAVLAFYLYHQTQTGFFFSADNLVNASDLLESNKPTKLKKGGVACVTKEAFKKYVKAVVDKDYKTALNARMDGECKLAAAESIVLESHRYDDSIWSQISFYLGNQYYTGWTKSTLLE